MTTTTKTEKGPRRPALTRKVMRGLTHLYDRFDCAPYQAKGQGDARSDLEAAFAWINSQLERRGMEHDPEPRRIALHAPCETDGEPAGGAAPEHTRKTYGPGTRSHEVAQRVVRDANERAAAAGGGA